MLLLVIQMDVVVGDIFEVRRREIELRRIDLFAFCALHSQIQVGAELLGGVVGGEFGAVLFAVAIIERRQDDGRTELPFID